MVRRTGRRPGNPDTRQAILDAARKAFAERGYDSISIRAIATGAGVDPALVHHYFATKQQLFLACINAPIDPRELLPTVLAAAPRDQIGTHLVRAVLGLWESPAGVGAAALLRTAMSSEETAQLLREFLTTQILRQVIVHLGLDESEAPPEPRSPPAIVLGIVVARYILHLQPLASAPLEQVVALIGPTVHHYLTDDLPAITPTTTVLRRP